MIHINILKTRTGKLRNALKRKGIDALLITDTFNIFYLTDFIGLSPNERESVCLVDQNRVTLIIPRLYEEEARKNVSPDIGINIVNGRNELFTVIKQHFHSYKNIGIEADNITLREYLLLNKTFHSKIIPTENIIQKLRSIKDKREVLLIKKAVKITDLAFMKISREIKLGQTEKQISEMLVDIMEQLGAEGPAFEPIVASGAVSSIPHYKTSNNKIKEGILLIDAGARFKGYNADLTRTFYLGHPDSLFIKRYNLLLNIQERLIDEIKPGFKEEDMYLKTQKYLGNNAEYFTHSTGHGIGIEVHEKPHLRKGGTDLIKQGMVVTVEPGIYFTGWGGIRIEDYILITEKGCLVLSEMKKDLQSMLIKT